ncbi:MAG: hypothetical protein OCD01_06345 [Fibrobacterales bacterium]
MYTMLSNIVLKPIVPLLLVGLIAFGCSKVESDARHSLEIEDYPRAERLFSKALDSDPLNGQLRLEYIESLIGSGTLYLFHPKKQAYYLDRLVRESIIAARVALPLQKRDSLIGVLYTKGYGLYSDKKYGKAERYLSAAHALNSKSIEVKNILALTCSKLDKSEQTIALFTELLNQHPQYISAYINLGNHYWAKGDVEEAYITWSLGIEIAPSDPYLQKWVQIAHDELILLTLGEE